MPVILGEEISDWNYESSYSSKVYKWWKCPQCNQEFRFRFNGYPPWPPLDLKCPECWKESPIPWPSPALISWRCGRCGVNQMVSRLTWYSQERKYTEVFFSICTEEIQTHLSCDICSSAPPGGYGPPKSFGDAAKRTFYGAVAGALGIVVDILADETPEQARAHACHEVMEAESRFDGFLRKLPQIRAEQARIAEEESRKAALEAEKLEEELRLLRKEASNATGLKRMKPINFEFSVASLYLKLGYDVYVTPASGDKGIDLIVVKDKEQIAIQCKKYKHPVPVSQVRDFYGSFVGIFNKGIFITSSEFSKGTLDWVEERNGLELVNGEQLVKLFLEHQPKIVRNFKNWKESEQ